MSGVTSCPAAVCRVPAVVVRFLDYPALELKLVTDSELCKIRELVENDPESLTESPQISQLQHSTGTYAFTQGKSCMIKVKLSDLEENLSTIPVYVMVLDVLPTAPKLVASFALSLESATKRIVRDVSVNGIETPCAHGERDIFPLYNLMGSKVGETEMGVRLSSLGVNMIQHVSKIVKPVSDINELQGTSPNRRKSVLPMKSPVSTTDSQTLIKKIKVPDKVDSNDNKENIALRKNLMVSGSTQTLKPKMPSKSVQFPVKAEADTLGSTENIFCPPALYYDCKSDVMEKELCVKRQKALMHQQVKIDRSIRLSDLTSDGQDKLVVPSSAIYRSSQPQKKSVAAGDESQNGTPPSNDFPRSLSEFPILRALVAEVARLGLGDVQATTPQGVLESVMEKEGQRMTKEEPAASKPKKRIFPLHKSPKKQQEHKGPLKFGLTNTMRLRMAMTKANLEQQRKEKLKTSQSRDSLQRSRSSVLGRTFVKSATPRGGKRIKMVSTACGPDDSMYRRHIPKNVQQRTVYMGRVAGYEEATDQDVPSMGHMTSESPAIHDEPAKENEFGIEDLMIVKDIGTPRAHSRQSQRSIEIHLPTASTEFTIGKDDDWRSTVSDQEKLLERMKAAEEDEKYDEPGFYTPPDSADTSRPQSVAEIRGAGTKKGTRVRMSESIEKFSQSEASASERYRYSDDFEDDKTWSANRTPSAMTPVNSTAIKEEEENIPVRPSKSMDSTLTTTRTSDYESTAAEDVIKPQDELRSGSAQKITSSDDAVETSSVGSVVTALMPAKSGPGKESMKVGNKMVPGPIPSDSPVIQSMNTESGSMENFPEPKKLSLTSKSMQRKKKSSSKNIHLPKTIEESRKSKRDPPAPKPSRFTPSPPSTRRFSPVSSPESSKERMKRMFHHPGRRTRPTSSGSASSDFEKPLSPVRRSDSVSSYQPSDISEISNVRLSEDLENLSDILSEDTDSQDTTRFRKNKKMPTDGPRTYFGKPKLDPSTKLGYTT